MVVEVSPSGVTRGTNHRGTGPQVGRGPASYCTLSVSEAQCTSSGQGCGSKHQTLNWRSTTSETSPEQVHFATLETAVSYKTLRSRTTKSLHHKLPRCS
ncbi:hypothetical protein EVAR_90933_1 [Eumeta japonica]|uniref:Uncharacterized protein n=1 Tax=Eumeta variegata TaxID=151549 RepID=A0A4C1SME7_EUMVA|nr:hypothetical protein EVAR_90933_1 [Eumeta japonica]